MACDVLGALTLVADASGCAFYISFCPAVPCLRFVHLVILLCQCLAFGNVSSLRDAKETLCRRLCEPCAACGRSASKPCMLVLILRFNVVSFSICSPAAQATRATLGAGMEIVGARRRTHHGYLYMRSLIIASTWLPGCMAAWLHGWLRCLVASPVSMFGSLFAQLTHVLVSLMQDDATSRAR